MTDALLYLASAFWIGAVHAATPGHGKTIAAAYIVGARGKPVDAVILGIFVTLSHTSGIVLVGILASIGMPGMVPHRIEGWLAVITGVLVGAGLLGANVPALVLVFALASLGAWYGLRRMFGVQGSEVKLWHKDIND